MSGRVLHAAPGGLSGEEALADALSSSHPVIAAMARLQATGASEAIADWLNAELRRPKADPATVLHALGMCQIQMIGSIAAQMASPQGDRPFIDAYVDLVREHMPAHMAASREALQASTEARPSSAARTKP